MSIAPGTLLNNRYRILSVLGQGGMGAVYRARDENLNIYVAVKENLFLTDEYARQFQREATILATLRHASLPRVGDYFVIPGQGQYLIMDFIDGEDLRQRIERTNILSEYEVALIGIAICEALSYLHTRRPPIIHRDIKPGNIKITPEGEIALVDFGLAKVFLEHEATTTGARAMTPGYSPPEQYGTAPTDERSDVYSLGATLYAALTGAIPEDALARATGKARLTGIRQLQPHIDRKLASAIEKAMEVDPEDRYQTAAEFRQALAEAANIHTQTQAIAVAPPPFLSDDEENPHLPASGSKPSHSKVVSNKARRRIRNPWVGWGVFFTCLLVISTMLFARPDWRDFLVSQLPIPVAPPPTQVVDTPVPEYTATFAAAPVLPSPTNTFTATLPQLTKTLVPTRTPTITPTPIGGGSGQIAFASNQTGVMQIYLINVDGTNLIQVTDMPSGACQPAWAPDGKRLVFISPCLAKQEEYWGAKIYVTEIGSNQPPTLLPIPSDAAGDFSPAWSPDGRYIVFTSMRDSRLPHLYLLDLVKEETILLSDMDARERQPAWSPDGKLIAYVREQNFAQIWLMLPDGSNPERFSLSGPIHDLYPAWSPDGNFLIFSQMKADVRIPSLAGMRLQDKNTYNEYTIPLRNQTAIGPISNASFSPDGFWIVYEGWPNGSNHDIYLMTSSGVDPIRITTLDSFEFDPAWRP